MMKTLRRWTSSLIASFESVVNQIENHEALVNSAIREVQESGARARVQLARVQKDGQNMRQRIEEVTNSLEQWKERAVRSAASDKARALECVKRARQAEKEAARLECDEREHAKLERQLSEDMRLIDDRLAKLKEQRNILRTRQSRAEALKPVNGYHPHLISEIDGIFERWDEKVTSYEIQYDHRIRLGDKLEQEFNEEEEAVVLNQALDALLSNVKTPAYAEEK